jgi:AraC-like DNA-binding protein
MCPRAICEPSPLPPGRTLAIERVRHSARSLPSDRFVHFHDAVELVLFEHVAGVFSVEGRSYRLGDRTLILAPSMAVHDFALTEGAKAWTLLQLAPFMAQAAAGMDYAALLTRPACVRLDARNWRRAETTFDWLGEAAADPSQQALSLTLIRSILGLLAQSRGAEQPAPTTHGSGFGRLRPAIERLQERPGEMLSASHAARLCRMSSAYFSRRFKAVTGRSFSDYAADYRLLLAAHRLLAEPDPISRIAFETGFTNPSHFAARFRERFGMSPRAYRRAGLKYSSARR